MKKILVLLLVFAFMASFSACGDGLDTAENSDSNDPVNSVDSNLRADDEGSDVQVNPYESLKNAQVGDYISFGKYEQDKNSSNGKEDIEWLVLKKEGKRIFVISKYVLDGQEFYSKKVSFENGMPAVTWDMSTLRQWLNKEFLNAAFSSEERNMIPTVTVAAEYYRSGDPDPGKATQDKLFFLSRSEVEEYLDSDLKRQCEATNYAISKRVEVSDRTGKSSWPLRSPGQHTLALAGVNDAGEFDRFIAGMVDDIVPVRPAMWIELDF